LFGGPAGGPVTQEGPPQGSDQAAGAEAERAASAERPEHRT